MVTQHDGFYLQIPNFKFEMATTVSQTAV